jgi:adenosylmethionine-8-amino-7-oxononanoate aminotransferase
VHTQSLPSWPFVPSSSGSLQIARTRGAYLLTSQGRAIFDAAAGAAVGNIGWGRSEVIEAVSAAAGNRTYVLPNLVTEERLELIDRLQQS